MVNIIQAYTGFIQIIHSIEDHLGQYIIGRFSNNLIKGCFLVIINLHFCAPALNKVLSFRDSLDSTTSPRSANCIACTPYS